MKSNTPFSFKIGIVFLGLIAMLAYLSCNQPAANNETEDVTGIIQAKWEQFIDNWQAENADSCILIYHDDVTLIPLNNAEIRSSNDVAGFYQSLFDAHLPSRYIHNSLSINSDKNIAVERADFSVYWTTLDNTPWTFEARMMALWQKDNEGEWKIKTIIFTGVPEKDESSLDEES